MPNLQDITSAIGSFFQSHNPFQQQPQFLPQPSGNAINTAQGQIPFRGPQTLGSQTQAPAQQPMPTQIPISTPAPTPADLSNLTERIRAGYRSWNGGQPVPMEQYIPQMVQATQQYPIFQKNPFLLPAVSIVETGAGKNWRLNNNPLSWAARVQQAGNYNPTSNEQSIMDMISAVGGDPNRGAGYSGVEFTNRQNAIAPYAPFRQSGNIQDFTNAYEPPSGNPNYYPALTKTLEYFK